VKVPDYSLTLGIPAKVVKMLSEGDQKRTREQLDEAYQKSREYLKIFMKEC
jgi:carbonic anhydrase/acetyltransferase-like protein (isoleucine patch superfamily)